MNEPEPMDDLERDLSRALRPVNPPETMVNAVMFAIAEEQRRGNPEKRTRAIAATARRFASAIITMWTLPNPSARAGSVLAVMLVLGAFAAEQVHARHQREQAKLAQQQFETAMRVTDQALDQTRQQLARAGLRFAE